MTIPAAAESCRAQAPLKLDNEKLAQAIHLAALDRNAARLAAEQSSTPLELLSLLQAGASACPNPVCRKSTHRKEKGLSLLCEDSTGRWTARVTICTYRAGLDM